MKPLSTEAQRLLELARAADAPAAEDDRRVRALLHAQIGAFTPAPAAAPPSSVGWFAHGALTRYVASVAVIAVAAAGPDRGLPVHRPAPSVTREPPRPTPPSLSRPESRAPLPAAQALGAAPIAHEGVSVVRVARPSVRTPSVTPAPRVAAPPVAQAPMEAAPTESVIAAPPGAPTTPRRQAETSPLAESVRLLSGAQSALLARDPSRALGLLDAHDARFGLDGPMASEAAVQRVLALCQLGRVTEARAVAGSLRERSPDSPLVARLRRSCAGDP